MVRTLASAGFAGLIAWALLGMVREDRVADRAQQAAQLAALVDAIRQLATSMDRQALALAEREQEDAAVRRIVLDGLCGTRWRDQDDSARGRGRTLDRRGPRWVEPRIQ